MARELWNRNTGTGSLAENSAQIGLKIPLKLFVIFTSGAIVGWYSSVFVNERNQDSLANIQLQLSECRNHNDILLSEFRRKDNSCDFILKEKLNDVADLKQQLDECRNQNGHLKDEKMTIEKQFTDEINLSNKKMSECQNRIEHLTVEHFTVVNQCGETPRNVLQDSSTKSENIFFKLTVLVMNAFLALVFLSVIGEKLEKKIGVAIFLLWCCYTFIIHSINTSVVSLSILVILYIPVVALVHTL